MSTSSRNKNLLFIIAALLLSNVAVLAYFLWIKQPEKKPDSPNRNNMGMVEKLRQEVGFNDQQLEEYKKLKEEQKNTIRPMFDEMRKAKDNFFRLLSDSTVSDSVIEKASNAIAERQKVLDRQTFAHFKKVRSLCTLEQQSKYDSLIQRMFRKMNKPPVHRNEQEKNDKSKAAAK